jgi:hypothetical protein
MITLVFREMSREGRNYLGMEGGHSSSVSMRSRMYNGRSQMVSVFCCSWCALIFRLPRGTLRVNVILWAPVQFRTELVLSNDASSYHARHCDPTPFTVPGARRRSHSTDLRKVEEADPGSEKQGMASAPHWRLGNLGKFVCKLT